MILLHFTFYIFLFGNKISLKQRLFMTLISTGGRSVILPFARCGAFGLRRNGRSLGFSPIGLSALREKLHFKIQSASSLWNFIHTRFLHFYRNRPEFFRSRQILLSNVRIYRRILRECDQCFQGIFRMFTKQSRVSTLLLSPSSPPPGEKNYCTVTCVYHVRSSQTTFSANDFFLTTFRV